MHNGHHNIHNCWWRLLSPTKEVNVFARVHLSVCMSVCVQDYSKTRAWIWMKCCVSTDVGTWTNWLTFEPDPDYSPDAGTGLLSPISFKLCYAEFYVRKIPRIRIGMARHCSNAWFYNGLFSHPSKQLCRRYKRYTECIKNVQPNRTPVNMSCKNIFARSKHRNTIWPSNSSAMSLISSLISSSSNGINSLCSACNFYKSKTH